MDAQTEVRVSLDELNHIIDRLHGRVLTQQARMKRRALQDRERQEQTLKNMLSALAKMRSLRAAMIVDRPMGYLH